MGIFTKTKLSVRASTAPYRFGTRFTLIDESLVRVVIPPYRFAHDGFLDPSYLQASPLTPLLRPSYSALERLVLKNSKECAVQLARLAKSQTKERRKYGKYFLEKIMLYTLRICEKVRMG